MIRKINPSEDIRSSNDKEKLFQWKQKNLKWLGKYTPVKTKEPQMIRKT